MPFSGGLVGFISYDSIRYIENIPDNCKDDLKLPDMIFGLYTDGIIIDRFANEAYYFSTGKFRLNEVERALKNKVQAPVSSSKIEEIRTNSDKETFEQNIQTAKEHLKNGEIFQVVLSRRVDINSDMDAVAFYEKLRKTNPSPYMFFLDFEEAKLIGASPESLVKVTGRAIETNPIAGTRPRGKTAAEDIKFEKELLTDEKENAEHVMLVDLGRNDIGKVSKFGSVKVPDFKTIVKYSHVQHLVSRVVGELRDGLTAFDGFKACFPAGTLTGAPKIRAMELIDELEPTRRGPYGGCVGYFSANGNADFAITIRSAVLKGKTFSVQAGAGIVIDSVPEKEFFEAENKAKALVSALKEEK